MSNHVSIYTDGSCFGNPGPGGWAYLVLRDYFAREDSGSEQNSTINRMELRAAIEALNSLSESADVTLYSDSRYLISGMTTLLPHWQQRAWRSSNGSAVQNQALWHELLRAAQRHRITWRWIPGHTGIAEQEQVDRLSRQAARHEPRLVPRRLSA